MDAFRINEQREILNTLRSTCFRRPAEIKSPKTVNNILAVLSILLKKAVEWDVIERMPCRIKLLPIEKDCRRIYGHPNRR